MCLFWWFWADLRWLSLGHLAYWPSLSDPLLLGGAYGLNLLLLVDLASLLIGAASFGLCFKFGPYCCCFDDVLWTLI
ncbi:hypothetical protein U1Q18_013611 [Sarracenia purpurea var. burkii]